MEYNWTWWTPNNVNANQATLSFHLACRHSSISFEVVRNTNGYRYFEYRITAPNGATHSSGKITSTTYGCGGLQENTTYKVEVLASISSSGPRVSMARNFTTTSFTPWSWDKSNGYLGNLNGTATAAQTKKAYTAITTKGPLSDFSYLVWNDMVNKAYQIRFEQNKPWDNTYATYASTKMNVFDKAVTSKRIRSLFKNLNATIGKANVGDPIEGAIFDVAIFTMNLLILSIKQNS